MNILEFEKPIIELEKRIAELKAFSSNKHIDLAEEIKNLEEKLAGLRKGVYKNLSPWQRIQLARHPQRPYTLDYIRLITENFVELHGDRLFRDDKALIAGLAKIDKYKVAIMGHQKGRDIKENIERFFGCAHPEGYRKALRVMQLAGKFNLPVVCLIDTPGAYPGIGAEERGQALAIAFNLREMFSIEVPIIAAVIGEGGSGGALGIGIADKMLIMENAYYSVISPEGCAAILWKDSSKAPEAAKSLKITPADLLKLGIVDEIVPEPLGGAHKNHEQSAAFLKTSLVKQLEALTRVPKKELLQNRYNKFRAMGVFIDEDSGTGNPRTS